jgi:hypothetical protein
MTRTLWRRPVAGSFIDDVWKAVGSVLSKFPGSTRSAGWRPVFILIESAVERVSFMMVLQSGVPLETSLSVLPPAFIVRMTHAGASFRMGRFTQLGVSDGAGSQGLGDGCRT